MIVVMAGLPGSGKSTIANALAQHLSAAVLNKDTFAMRSLPRVMSSTRASKTIS